MNDYLDIATLRECVKQLRSADIRPKDPSKFYSLVATPFGMVSVASDEVKGAKEAIRWLENEWSS